MKKMISCLFAAALLVCGSETLSAQKKSADGVTINGVTWAASNVGAKGKFAKNSWNEGRYYSFDEAQSACPAGWRAPSMVELESLLASEIGWATENGVGGYKFGKDGNTIFLPAFGGRYAPSNEVKKSGGEGFYWTSLSYSGADLDYKPRMEHNRSLAYFLRFDRGSAYPLYHGNRSFGFQVRCVKK